VPEVVQVRNGMVVRLAPGPAEIIDAAPVGRLYKDGDILIGMAEPALPERRKLSFAGIVSVAIAVDADGKIAGDPVIDAMGLPERNRQGENILDIVADAVGDVLDGLSKAKRRDPESVENAVVRTVRAAVNEAWGKKPACHVLVIEV
jgi:ribonuclease J